MASGGTGTIVGTFLIADIRGYTTFTQERGDEAAATLAARFAEVAKEAIESRGGSLVELRGDEALAVFTSPRDAIRAAIDLQDRCIDHTVSDPDFPLLVGVGLDAGEAVPVGDGWRGSALNQAARLCSRAAPGQILTSKEFVHLAGTVEQVSVARRGSVALKGLREPVDVMEIASTTDPAVVRIEQFVPRAMRGKRRRRFTSLVLAAAAALIVAIVVPLVLTKHGSRVPSAPTPPRRFGPGVVRLDPATGSEVTTVAIADAQAVATGEHGVWVATAGVDEIAPSTGAVLARIPTVVPGFGPTRCGVGGSFCSIAVGGGKVWLTNSLSTYGRTPVPPKGVLFRIDPTSQRVDMLKRFVDPTAVVFAAGSVWVASSQTGEIYRLDPRSFRIEKTIEVESSSNPDVVAASGRSIWVVNGGGGSITRIDARTGRAGTPIPVRAATSIAADATGVWVSDGGGGNVTEYTSDGQHLVQSFPVGPGIGALAIGEGSVFVVNPSRNEVARIDTSTGRVTRRIRVSNPYDVAIGAGGAWITS